MGNKQGLMSKHRMYFSTPSIAPPNDRLAPLVAATREALDELGRVVSTTCFREPDAVTPEGITAYALALIRLRECALAAGLERLKNACDALAVTVAKLIEDRANACREVCESLTRFVVYAEEMLRMHPQYAAETHHG
jgi:hypothetical protein